MLTLLFAFSLSRAASDEGAQPSVPNPHLTLVKAGRARAGILVATNSSTSEFFAVKELQSFIPWWTLRPDVRHEAVVAGYGVWSRNDAAIS